MFIIIYPQELKELAALVCCESWLWWQQRTQGWVCQIRGGCFSKAALWDPPPVHRLSIDCSCYAEYILITCALTHIDTFAFLCILLALQEVWMRKKSRLNGLQMGCDVLVCSVCFSLLTCLPMSVLCRQKDVWRWCQDTHIWLQIILPCVRHLCVRRDTDPRLNWC